MPAPIKILHLEDNPMDVELVQRAFKKDGILCDITVVQNRNEFIAALESQEFDVVLIDYQIPGLDGITALESLHKLAPNVPGIIVTGALTEETAVECLKTGAVDYVLKQSLIRLGPAVKRAIELNREKENKDLAEKALRTSVERMRAFANAMPDLAFILDDAGTYVEVLTENEDLLYQNIDQLVGKKITDVHTEQEAKLFLETVRKTIETGKSQRLEYMLNVPAGLRSFEARTAFIPGEAGKKRMVIWVSRDVTERIELEEQLRQALKMEAVGRLAGGVAHDFNNILSVIMGYAQIGLCDLKERDPMYKSFSQIMKASVRAATLTRQLLAFSSKQVLMPRVVNINEIIQDLKKMLARLIGEDIELNTFLDPLAGHIKIDPGQFEQILMNLAVNARDAMPNGGQFTIESQNKIFDEPIIWGDFRINPGSYLMIRVSDSGCGMNQKTLAHIFEPFFTTKKKEQGTGLGLSTVYGIVSQSNGYIDVKSAPGEGSCFKLYFPQVDEPAQKIKKTSSKTKFLNGNETILVVEDEDALRQMVCLALKQHGYHTLEAPHGGSALLKCEKFEGEIHLIVTDVVMPEMSGRQMVERLQPLRPKMKVLYMSGYTDDAVIQHGVKEKETDFIHKPFSPMELVRKIREILDK